MEMVLPKIPQLLTTILGFVLIVLVLKKFAWGPILDILDQRRDKIKSDFAEAEQNLQEAEQLKGNFENKLGDIKVIEREKIQEAVKRGEELATGIVTDARSQADTTRLKADADLEIEAQKARLELRDSVVNMAIGAAEKVIGERLDDDKHRKLIQEYIDNLGEMPNA